MAVPRWVLGAMWAFLVVACADSDEGTRGGEVAATTVADGPSPTAATSGQVDAAPGTGDRDRATPAPPQPLDGVDVVLEVVATLDVPIDMAVRPDDAALYVAERAGRVVRVDDPDADARTEVVLDITGRMSTRGEQGLLAIAFGPDGRLYASYTDPDGASTIASWEMDGNRPDRSTEVVHIAVAQPFANHNGGDIEFGPDGLLYWALGDGGSSFDPLGSGQDTATLLGALLRIAPAPGGYEIPADNPFVGRDGRDEIWVYGLRNPWRFSFDPDTGDLWIGDVGQNELEEVDLLAAGAAAGANLGWSLREGTRSLAPSDEVLVDPVHEYGRSLGRSITGGVVYRGTGIDGLAGAYLYSDYAGGWLRGLRVDGTTVTEDVELLDDAGPIVSFATDHRGEVYLIGLDGAVARLVAG